jgi:hypothetical protein
MSETSGQQFLLRFRNFGEALSSDLITVQEFIDAVFDLFAHVDRVYVEIIPSLWDLAPESIRGEFSASIRRAATPGFRWHPFKFGGGRRMTEEEIRQDAELRTARVQTWSIEFVRFLDGSGRLLTHPVGG